MKWLFKEEPTHYSYDDLAKEKKTSWSGVRNPVAQKHLRSVRKGDSIFYYHTGDEKSVVGVMKASGGRPVEGHRGPFGRLIRLPPRPVLHQVTANKSDAGSQFGLDALLPAVQDAAQGVYASLPQRGQARSYPGPTSRLRPKQLR